MSESFEKLFSNDFLPHGHCYFWTPQILWLHVVSDIIIFLSYYSIPVALVYFVKKKEHLPFNWIFWMFGLFILLCGTTHIFSVYTTWSGAYGVEGLLKAVTAIVSLITAVAIWPLLPKALALGSIADLSDARKQLEQILKQTDFHAQLLKKNREELQTFTQGAVSREMQMIELKQKINSLSKELGRSEPYDLSFVRKT